MNIKRTIIYWYSLVMLLTTIYNLFEVKYQNFVLMLLFENKPKIDLLLLLPIYSAICDLDRF
jgi:hypothetical protein